MRRLTILLLAAFLLLHSVAWAHDEKLQAELLDEVLRLTQAEVPDDIILEQIRAWEFVFELTADDIVELRTLGVSDTVLEALIGTAPEFQADSGSGGHVVFTAGYYAPWYWFPVAWGGYCDPFPNLYCAYYYPFRYQFASFGYYGWCGSTYYAHYAPPGGYPRHAWNRRGAGSPYTVASGLGARRADTITIPAASGARSATAPRVIRGTTTPRTSTALQRGTTLRHAESSRRAQPGNVVRGPRQTGRSENATLAVDRAISARRAAGSRLGASGVRESRQAVPSASGAQSARVLRGSAPSQSRSLSWSRPSSGRAVSMPRFQAPSRGSLSAPRSSMSAPRSMAAPPAVSARLGGRGR